MNSANVNHLKTACLHASWETYCFVYMVKKILYWKLSWLISLFHLKCSLVSSGDGQNKYLLFQWPLIEFSFHIFIQDFFGKPAFLTVSGQLNAETYATALSDVSLSYLILVLIFILFFNHKLDE